MMEERRYPIFDEEDGSCKVCEPVGAVALSDHTDEFVDDDVTIPDVIPASFEEALADIEQSEREFEEGRGIPWEDVKLMIEDHIRSYAR